MLVPTWITGWMSSNMADGNQQKHLLASFATKASNIYQNLRAQNLSVLGNAICPSYLL